MRIPSSQLPGTMPLVTDYLYNYEKVADFYNGNFRDLKTFQSRSTEVSSRNISIGQVVSVLKDQNQHFGCGFQTLEKIDLLLERRACAVVTGQQAGLFSGPLYTIYKALTAIKLAARLNRNCKGCYVPVFWLASDDHDFREVNHINIIDKNNQIKVVNYHDHPLHTKTPISEIRLTAHIFDVIQQLKDATHPSEFKQKVITVLSDAYQPDHSFSEAFGIWLMNLFKSFGLILIDASDPKIKELAKHVFHKEIVEKSPSSKQALATSKTLKQKNYHTQVQLHHGRLNLFLAEKERQTIQIKNGTYVVKESNRTFQTDELLNLLEKKPHLFSPNVLLRPIYQDALLPTVAYVAGFSEIAYYAQMKGIYASFNLPMPIIYPRKNITLVENKVDNVLNSYGLEIQDFWGNVEILINNIARAQLPKSIEKNMNKAVACIERDFNSIKEEIISFEPTLKATIEGVAGKMFHQIKTLEKKILQAYKKRNDIVRQQLCKAENNLFPQNQLQERKLNVIPFLFKYGFGFIDRLYEAIDISNFDHQIIRL